MWFAICKKCWGFQVKRLRSISISQNAESRLSFSKAWGQLPFPHIKIHQSNKPTHSFISYSFCWLKICRFLIYLDLQWTEEFVFVLESIKYSFMKSEDDLTIKIAIKTHENKRSDICNITDLCIRDKEYITFSILVRLSLN